MAELTQARLKELTDYDPASGEFSGLHLSRHKYGYMTAKIGGVRYFAHRLAVLYMTGEFPEHDTDHANGDRADNRWLNISPRTYSENQQNRGGPQRNNKLGVLGVRRHKSGKFIAQIRVNRVQHHLGLFNTISEASSTYMAAKLRLHTNSPRLLKNHPQLLPPTVI